MASERAVDGVILCVGLVVIDVVTVVDDYPEEDTKSRYVLSSPLTFLFGIHNSISETLVLNIGLPTNDWNFTEFANYFVRFTVWFR